jgi:hypothetical protein
VHLPVRQVLRRDQAACFLRGRGDRLPDVAAIKALVGGHDGLLARLARGERLALRVDELLERAQEFGLAKNLAGQRCRPPLGPRGVVVAQEHAARRVPARQHVFGRFDVDGLRFLDRVPRGHRERRAEHLLEAQRAEPREHH